MVVKENWRIFEMRKLNVAIIGQGRSGRDIHGKFFRSESNDFCNVVCIVEADEARREKAKIEFGCDVVADYTELFGRTDIDVVVNASFSHMHYPISKDLLVHGFNVLSEKPFGRSYYECMDLINTAKQHGVIITAFHQTLFTPAFLKVKELLNSGKIGRPLQINVNYSGFSRRWDWQTLQNYCAGSIYNTGPHPIGMALSLIDWDENAKVAYSDLDIALTSGDAPDYGKIIIKAPGRPTIDIEVNSVNAYGLGYVFKILGTKGTISATNGAYKMKYIEDVNALPARPVIREPLSNAEGNPAYCSEHLETVEETGEVTGSAFDVAVRDFYKLLADSIIDGKPLAITPEQAAMVIGVIETCHAQNPLPVLYE